MNSKCDNCIYNKVDCIAYVDKILEGDVIKEKLAFGGFLIESYVAICVKCGHLKDNSELKEKREKEGNF